MHDGLAKVNTLNRYYFLKFSSTLTLIHKKKIVQDRVLNIDAIEAEVLPNQKGDIVKRLKQQRQTNRISILIGGFSIISGKISKIAVITLMLIFKENR